MNKVLAICILLASSSANAGGDIKAAISGFLSGTLVSDPDFYEHTARGAVNLDVTKDSYAFHTQLASSVEFPIESLISRITFEKSFYIDKGQEMSVIIGRFPRLFSFYNNITDAVGTSGFAMLPLSQYKRRYVVDSRMISGDGLMVNYRYHEDDFSLEFTADVNRMSKANSCLIHMEFYNKPCGQLGYGYTSDNPNFDFGLQYDSVTLRVVAAITFIDIKSELKNPKDPLALATYTLANSWSHRLYKLGVIKTIDDWWIQTEGTLRDIKKAEISKDLEDFNVQWGGYVIGGYHFSPALNGYLGYSISRSEAGKRYDLDDRFVGVTYANGDGMTYSLEYHNGNGRDWNRYLSPDDSWSSAVLSVTKQF